MADYERRAPSFSGSPGNYYSQILRMAESEARIPVRSVESVTTDKQANRKSRRRRSRFEQPQYDTPEDDFMRVVIDGIKRLDPKGER